MTLRQWRRKLVITCLLVALIVVLYWNHKRLTADLRSLDARRRVGSGGGGGGDGRHSPSAQESAVDDKPIAADDLTWRLLTTIDTNIIDIEGVYDKKLVDLSELKKCDLCLGIDFCHTLVTNLLVTTAPALPSYISLRNAVMKTTNEKITLMSQSSDKWSRLESIVCANASQRVATCDHSLAVRNSFMAKSDLFAIDNYRHLFRQIVMQMRANGGHQQNELFLQGVFTQCTTKKYLQLLQNSFDTNDDKRVDLSEQSHLLSSLLAFPGYAVHRMLSKSETDLQTLKIRGVCGRLVAFEGNFQTLADFIAAEKSFEVIAGLAVQIIQLVDDLQDEDPNWYYLHTELTIDSYVVNTEGEVFLSDLNHMLVIDKSLLEDHSLRRQQSLLHSQVCNEPCFQTFHKRFLEAFNTTSSLPSLECQRVHLYYGQHMYAMICRNIFSSLEMSAAAGDDSQRPPSGSSGRPSGGHPSPLASVRTGLLSSVPNKDRENVDDLLRECVYETSPGGRKQALFMS
ncbi:unnamed protein product [Medioppia subpectinata]|uniref:FAM69 protein-kinase domain-containing protein n=1 Tax=Medioppia subpectinata TaxID=1979941 RepID=A0A7R9KM60_9ACAR|nr:unnamed protein product [Medioppia subpectinata]CAG2106171.1 unnamed protein product [Medioppia subpectinata]